MIKKDWKYLTLGECCDILNNKRIALNANVRCQRQGIIPYWGANGVIDYVDDYLFNEPLLVISEDSGYFKQADHRPICYLADGKNWIGNHAHVLRIKPGFDRLWLYYWFVHRDITPYVHQGTRMKLNLSQLQQLSVYIPPIEEQQKIIRLFVKVDRVSHLLKTIIKIYQQLMLALLQQLLTQGIEHNHFKQTILGKLPQAWHVKRLAEIAKLKRGKFSVRPRNDPRYYGGDMPFVQTADIAHADGYLRHYQQTLNQDGVAISKVFKKGTLLVTIAAHIGDIALATFDTACPDSIVAIQPDQDIDSVWLMYYMKMQRPKLLSLATQNTQKNINLKVLKAFPIAIPPLAEQKKIASYLSSVNDCLQLTKERLANTVLLKQALRQTLLTEVDLGSTT